MSQSKSTPSPLVPPAAAAETTLIGPNGHAIVKLASSDTPASPKRRLGFLEGELVVPGDFDAPLPEDVLADFGGDR